MPTKEDKVEFTLKEVTTSLVRDRGIRSGFWRLYVNFGMSATNIETPDGGPYPASIVPLTKMGIIRVDATQEDGLTVDASLIIKSTKAKKP